MKKPGERFRISVQRERRERFHHRQPSIDALAQPSSLEPLGFTGPNT
jgi:hypothetical protein